MTGCGTYFSRYAWHFLSSKITSLISASDDPAGWLDWRLDEKQQLPIHMSPSLVDLYKTVRYRQQAGVAIKISSAYGVPG